MVLRFNFDFPLLHFIPYFSFSGANATVFQNFFNICIFKYVQASKISFFKHADKFRLITVLLSHWLFTEQKSSGN